MYIYYIRKDASRRTQQRFQPQPTPIIPDKTEIDSDNIETPPATRRLFSPTRDVSTNKSDSPNDTKELGYTLKDGFVSKDMLYKDNERKEAENKLAEVLGDGQFDRFSSARRTRRYKRSTDYNSGKLYIDLDLLAQILYNN